MIILGIETSCDETSISLIESKVEDGKKTITILGDVVLSQMAMHEKYGGVYPALAKREHSKNLVPVLQEVLKQANFLKKSNGITDHATALKKMLEREPELLDAFLAFIPDIEKPAIDAIAVTQGPGLEPALWVGINFAKALSLVWDIPLYPMNHMEGHVLAGLLEERTPKTFELTKVDFPSIALLISGGHTEIVEMKDWLSYKVVGSTRDDAVGEAYDKVARILGLPYPGGPQIEKLARLSRQSGVISPFVFPRPMLHSNDLSFSFSGLKTSVLYTVKKIESLDEITKGHLAAAFEDAVIEVLTKKVRSAIERTGARALILGGGVIANSTIREAFVTLAKDVGISLHLPHLKHSTDNAFMIALAASFYAEKQKPPASNFEAEGNLSFISLLE